MIAKPALPQVINATAAMMETAVRKTFLPTLQSKQSNQLDQLQVELRAYLEQNQLGFTKRKKLFIQIEILSKNFCPKVKARPDAKSTAE